MPRRPMTSARMERLQLEFKLFYKKVCRDIGREALALDSHESRIYDWRDPNRYFHMPAYALLASSVGDEIIEWMRKKRLEDSPRKLNGSMDDEWIMLTMLFSRAREKFENGEPYDPRIAYRLTEELEKMLAEWEGKSTD